MKHGNQKFLTILLVLSAVWLFALLEPVVYAIAGAKCAKVGDASLQLADCTRVLPASGPLPEGVEMLVLLIGFAGLALCAAASYEMTRRHGSE